MSFAKEMEDFLTGFKAGQSIVGDVQDRQMAKEKFEIEKEAAEAKQYEDLLGPDPASLRPKKVKKVTSESPYYDSSYEYNDAYDDSSEDAPNAAEAEAEEDEGGGWFSFATGGMVPSARGLPRKKRERRPDGTLDPLVGYVGPDEEIIPAEAIPTGVTSQSNPSLLSDNSRSDGNPPPPEGTTPSRGGGIRGLFQSAENAIKDAMNGFAQEHSQQGAVGAEPEIDFVTGRGAATSQEVKAMDAKIDPNGEMTPWDRGRARLGAAYEFFISRGEPEKAKRIAQRLVLFDKMASETRGKLAVQMVATGHDAEAAQMLSDAYNENIHDGNTLHLGTPANGITPYQIVDDDGNVVEEGQANRQQVAEMAGNVASGQAFYDSVATKGDEPAASTPAAPAQPPVPTEPPVVAPAPAPAPAAAVPAEAVPAEAGPTSAIPVEEPAPAAPAPAPAAPAQAVPAAPAPELTPSAPAEATRPKRKVVRDMRWAKKVYQKAVAVKEYWDAKVAEDPTPENKARQRDADIRYDETEQDVFTLRMKGVKKGADPGQVQTKFMDDLDNWAASANRYSTDPPMPSDGLRGAEPAAAVPATPAVGAAGAVATAAPAATPPVTSGSNSKGKPIDAVTMDQFNKAIAAGKSRMAAIGALQAAGFDTTGL